MTVEQITGDIYPPSAEILNAALINNRDVLANMATQDLSGFWEEQAKEFEWFSPWDKVLDDSNKPFYKWFVGGKTNIVYNCLDRHVADLAAQQAGPDLGRRERRRCAPSPTTPSTAKSACSPTCCAAWASRKATGSPSTWAASPSCPSPCWPAPRSARCTRWCTAASRSKRCTAASRTASPTWSSPATAACMNGKIVELKKIVDEALKRCATVEHVIVVKRTGQEVPMEAGPRLLVPRPDGPARGPIASGQLALRDRSDGRRRPALHALHLRHHRQAQGHPAHPRRLHGRRRHHAANTSSTSRKKTAAGAPPTPAGSPGTATSSTGRCCWARPASCTKARRPTPIPTAGGAWSRSTASTSSTPPPPPSAA